jgi:2-polyprenyl-6-methoxyphenol hydroxylase-like FAD-dependent oxidoreductase
VTRTYTSKVLVIGGGIAGTATALGLHKAGHDVTVFEAHPDTAEDIGAFLTLASNGMRALAQLDATDAVTAIGFPLTSLRVLDSQGTEVAHAPLGEAADPALRYRCLRRGELNAALQAEAARRGIPLRHGARLESVTDGPDGITARFADGSGATGDLLIGADGLNSTVRRLITPGVRPTYAGQRVFYGYTATAPEADPAGTITMVRGSGAAFGYAVSPAGETYWFARVGADPLPAGAPTEPPAALRARLLRRRAHGHRRRRAAPRRHLAVRTHPADRRRGPRGLPGQGASMALEDAVVLAKALRDLPDPKSAFAAYERHRRPRAEHNITVSGGISRGSRAPSRPAPGTARPVAPDEALVRQLAWGTALSADPPERH